MNSKICYLLTCAKHYGDKERQKCPSCGSSESESISSKYIVTRLRRCQRCDLQFRTPTTTSDENETFYQAAYKQGFTTDMPSLKSLRLMLGKKFKDTEQDYSRYIEVLSALGFGSGHKLLDFGCSWGYGSWQLDDVGFDVTAFEISKSRCGYAREHLGIRAHDELAKIESNQFDVFFSAHVLEHVPSVAEVFSYAFSKLRKNGLFIAFTPNGSNTYREENFESWNRFWGMVHPNFLDDRFYIKNIPGSILASKPYDCVSLKQAWGSGANSNSFSLRGDELMIVKKVS